MADSFSGSPNQPPWLYRPTEQPILPASTARCRAARAALSTFSSSLKELNPGGGTSRYQICVLSLRRFRRSSTMVTFFSLSGSEPDVRLRARRQPEALKLDSGLPQRIDLLVERRDVLVAPVVDEHRDSQPFEHLSALHRPAMRGACLLIWHTFWANSEPGWRSR